MIMCPTEYGIYVNFQSISPAERVRPDSIPGCVKLSLCPFWSASGYRSASYRNDGPVCKEHTEIYSIDIWRDGRKELHDLSPMSWPFYMGIPHNSLNL